MHYFENSISSFRKANPSCTAVQEEKAKNNYYLYVKMYTSYIDFLLVSIIDNAQNRKSQVIYDLKVEITRKFTILRFD